MGSSTTQPGFKINFNFDNYRRLGVIPDIGDYLKTDVILNEDAYKKGNIDECIWKKEIPPVITPEWELRHITRMFTGVWIYIKDTLLWIPPNMYFNLMCCQAGGDTPQFRLKRLKHCYFKIWVRNNKKALGTYTIKNRQDGETSFAMADVLWECRIGGIAKGNIGMQSKNRETVKDSCWRNIQMHWDFIPDWAKKYLFNDQVNARDEMATNLKFLRQRTDQDEGRDILVKFTPAVYNAMDSMSNVIRCILDEVNKWEECSFYETFMNYEKFIAPGNTRKGLFDMFSTPADKNGKHNEEAYSFWKRSKWWDKGINGVPADKDSLDVYKQTGTTPTRIFGYYSNPLDGIEGMYDKFGDADPQELHDFIMWKRKNVEEKFRQMEIRAYPLDEKEMFGAFDSGTVWSNHKGLLDRQQYLRSIRFKDEFTKEPVRIYGNLEWPDFTPDSGIPVFRQADVTDFDELTARVCFSYLPPDYNRYDPLKRNRDGKFLPPEYVENCLGLDPYNDRYAAKNPSNQSKGAAVNYRFADLYNTGVSKVVNMYYNLRPYHRDILFEDMIKAAVFNRSLVQYENRNTEFRNYAEDRGYMGWLLPEIGQPKDSKRKGDSPGGKGKFLNEGIGLIDMFTNVPIQKGGFYPLDQMWFPEWLEDLISFNPKDTEKSNITMATIQAFIGAVKIMQKKIKKPSDLNHAVLDYLFT